MAVVRAARVAPRLPVGLAPALSALGRAHAPARRGYFCVPELKVTAEMMDADAADKRRSKRPGDAGTKNWLNEQEQSALARTGKTGVLELGNSCTQAVVTHYHRVCWTRGRVFIAVSKHGDHIVVDASTVRKVGEEATEDAVAPMVKALADALATPKVAATGAVFVNEGDVSNVKEAERTGREGHNEYKAASQVLQPAFHIYATGRGAGKVVTEALWLAATRLQGVNSGLEWQRDAALRRADRAAKRAEHHVRVLRWIERTPKIRALMPRGALDGYRAAEEAGTVFGTPAPGPKPSLSRDDRRRKAKRRTATADEWVRDVVAAAAEDAAAASSERA